MMLGLVSVVVLVRLVATDVGILSPVCIPFRIRIISAMALAISSLGLVSGYVDWVMSGVRFNILYTLLFRHGVIRSNVRVMNLDVLWMVVLLGL